MVRRAFLPLIPGSYVRPVLQQPRRHAFRVTSSLTGFAQPAGQVARPFRPRDAHGVVLAAIAFRALPRCGPAVSERPARSGGISCGSSAGRRPPAGCRRTPRHVWRYRPAREPGSRAAASTWRAPRGPGRRSARLRRPCMHRRRAHGRRVYAGPTSLNGGLRLIASRRRASSIRQPNMKPGGPPKKTPRLPAAR